MKVYKLPMDSWTYYHLYGSLEFLILNKGHKQKSIVAFLVLLCFMFTLHYFKPKCCKHNSLWLTGNTSQLWWPVGKSQNKVYCGGWQPFMVLSSGSFIYCPQWLRKLTNLTRKLHKCCKKIAIYSRVCLDRYWWHYSAYSHLRVPGTFNGMRCV